MNKAETQALIREKHGDKLDEATERLCKVCREAVRSTGNEFYSCGMRLLPITSDGSDCPYFKKQVER